MGKCYQLRELNWDGAQKGFASAKLIGEYQSNPLEPILKIGKKYPDIVEKAKYSATTMIAYEMAQAIQECVAIVEKEKG